MIPGSRQIAIALALAVAALVLVPAGHAAWRIGQSVSLARQSEALQQRPANPTARLLIVGDSTGVGTGASSPQASVAGLIAGDHPRLWIDNRAQDGARFDDVVAQLAGDARFDIVLVMAGGNDVIRLTDKEALRASIDRVVAGALDRADAVVLMPAGNVGNAPFFFPPFSWWMTQRSRSLHELIRDAARRHATIYVNLFKSPEEDPFVIRPGLNAVDGLHPSDSGYRVWYSELKDQADLVRRLARARGD